MLKGNIVSICLPTFGISVSELEMDRKAWLLSDAAAVNSSEDCNVSSEIKRYAMYLRIHSIDRNCQ